MLKGIWCLEAWTKFHGREEAFIEENLKANVAVATLHVGSPVCCKLEIQKRKEKTRLQVSVVRSSIPSICDVPAIHDLPEDIA